jgi:hypothetical protein
MESNRHGGMESNRHGGQIIGLLRYMPSNSGTSHHSQYPTLNGGDVTLIRRKLRIEKALMRAAPVGSLEPCRSGVRSLFVWVTPVPRKPSCPQ